MDTKRSLSIANCMDETTMAAATVAALTPFLVEGGKAVAKKIGDRVGDNVIKLYDTLKAKLVRASAKEALADLEQAPENTDRQAAMRVQLEKALSEDTALRDELAAVLQTIDTAPDGVRQEATINGDDNKTAQIAGSGNTTTIQ
jgi:hypothetical protein